MRDGRLALLCSFLVALSIAGCSHDSSVSGDPKQRLSDYISHSFSVKGPGDRADLLSYLAGDARARLLAWSDEQFKQAFVDSKRHFIKLSLLESKSISSSHLDMTYEVVYLDQGKGPGKEARVTNKKLCEMIQEKGKWLISDVHNIKEMVEYQNEMSLP